MKHLPVLVFLCILLLPGCSTKNNKEKSPERISPEMANTLKEAMVRDLTGSETSRTNDIKRYCDCVVDSLQSSFTTQQIMEAEFTDSRKYKKVQDTCLKSTRIK